ncbi:MAG: SPFH domain-containing protein, partial [Thermoanaerobaculia bacterium]|nr:SPFH domain-containing protein [Thermoanaerobaculia bacterium]
MDFTGLFIPILVAVLLLSLVTVRQGTVAVTTIFGKYQRTLHPGLNFRVPLIEVIFKRISIQNRAV